MGQNKSYCAYAREIHPYFYHQPEGQGLVIDSIFPSWEEYHFQGKISLAPPSSQKEHSARLPVV